MQKKKKTVKVEERKKLKWISEYFLQAVSMFYVNNIHKRTFIHIQIFFASFTLIIPLTRGSRNNSYDLLIFSKSACCNTAFEVFPCLIKYLLLHPVLSLYWYVVFQSLSTPARWRLVVLTFCANKMKNLWVCREFFFKCKNGFDKYKVTKWW